MFHTTGFGHRYRDVNGSWHGGHIRHSANLVRIIHTVLQTNHRRVRPNEWSHMGRSFRRIVGFDAEQNERAISNGAHLNRRGGFDSLLAFRFVENKTLRVNCVSEALPSDENHRRASAGKHSAEIPTYRARSYDCNSRPFSSFAHWLCFGGASSFKLYVEYAVGLSPLAIMPSTTRANVSVCQCLRVCHHSRTPSYARKSLIVRSISSHKSWLSIPSLRE